MSEEAAGNSAHAPKDWFERNVWTVEQLKRMGACFYTPPKPEEMERAQRLLEQVLLCCRAIAKEANPDCEPISAVIAGPAGRMVRREVDAEKVGAPIIEYRELDGRIDSIALSAADARDVTWVFVGGDTANLGIRTGSRYSCTGGPGAFGFRPDENGNAIGTTGLVTAEDIARFAFTRPRARGCCLP